MTKTQEEGFHWKRSDNSFSFNFVPEGTSPQPQAAATALETPPQVAGFAFNFNIPTASPRNTMEVAPEVANQNIDPPPSSSSKKKKKKKKGAGGSTNTEKPAGPPPEPQQESPELTPEQQLNRELDWCIEQLELGLKTRKTTPKQTEEAVRALKTLRNPKAPLVKKRQVMRAVGGDYRCKMEQERDKQFKLIQSSINSARVRTVTEPAKKPVFHRKAGPKAAEAHTSTWTPTEQTQVELSSDSTEGSIQVSQEGFVFKPSNEEFCFNFL
ncbi:hypothetical protein ACEWY4_025952 [Coilia grayii]|uniref:Uncharacterized protein n=1 Tax=Coilia grayii TaxID=363190 RepID=A0ABD1ITX0_9TELE